MKMCLASKSLGENQYITLAPRFVMEALGMVLIAFFAYLAVSLTKGTSDLNSTLPVLVALALAAQNFCLCYKFMELVCSFRKHNIFTGYLRITKPTSS